MWEVFEKSFEKQWKKYQSLFFKKTANTDGCIRVPKEAPNMLISITKNNSMRFKYLKFPLIENRSHQNFTPVQEKLHCVNIPF